MDIGSKIKDIRKLRAKTLKMVSSDTGLSISFLSQVERNSVGISIESLNLISSALNVSVAEFLTDAAVHKAVTESSIFNESRCFDNRGWLSEKLSTEFPGRLIFSTKIFLPPKFETDFYVNETEEFFFVLHGFVHFYKKSMDHFLRPGDSVHVRPNCMCKMRNISTTESIAIQVKVCDYE